MRPADRHLLRASLAAVWLVTAAVSVWELNGQSAAVLRNAGVLDAATGRVLTWAGAALDAVLGLLIVFLPTRLTYALALAAMLGMTAIATLLDPSLWLHPLGPLTKNLPIAAALWILARERHA